MNEDNSMEQPEPEQPEPGGQERAGGLLPEADAGQAAEIGGEINRTPGAKIRLFLLRAAAVFGALFLLISLVTAFAASYTSRPQFCRSCHNMEPYYASWKHSNHNKVSCVKCHFPPGVGEKVRGKMMGLVQLLKYVTVSAGPRPRAEIPDASCLRSGCHETRTLAGRVEFQGIHFDHEPHLTKMRRGKKLRCTSCHSQIVQGEHMTVTTSTCFLCHFKDEFLNEGLGTCTRCHQIPEEEFDLGGGAKFSHDLAYERGVDCANCHGDLIRGNGKVPQDRCVNCHNRKEDWERINDHEFLHRKHVTDHNVDCLDCHLEIEHSLDPHQIANAASDCASCHPKQHQEQVKMLQGVGAKSIPAQVSGMTMARISCPSCHQKKEVSPTGTIVWKASTRTCIECHDERAIEKFQVQHELLRTAMSEIEATIFDLREASLSADLDAEQMDAVTKQLDKLQDDLNFLRVGNGIHNIHYAGTLTRALVKQLSELCRELKIDEPNIVLPDMLDKAE